TTLSAAHQLGVYTNTPGCGICDVANADITVTFTVNSTTAGIVTITPADVTLHQNQALSDYTSVGTPASAGTYTITASATGFASPTSDLVTVTQPAFTIQRKSTRLNSSHDPNSYAIFCFQKQTSGITVTLSSSDSSKVGAP